MNIIYKFILLILIIFLVVAVYFLYLHLTSVNYNNNILLGSRISKDQLQIPKILSQTYHKKESIPEKVRENIRKYASDYNVVIYNDKEGADFIRKYFTGQVLDRYNELTGAHKADLLRYCILYINGGVYADIKTEFILPLSLLIKKSSGTNPLIYLVNSHHQTDTIYNGFIATPPGQELFLDAINFIVQKSIILPMLYYHYYIQDMFNRVTQDFEDPQPKAGFNAGIRNDFFLFEEHTTNLRKNCPDGLDRYGFCAWIYDNSSGSSNRVIKTRYSDYPW